jgi:hypothetical protein
VAVAVRQKFSLIVWMALILGPWSVFWVAAAVANKRLLPSYNSGSSRYGAGGKFGA